MLDSRWFSPFQVVVVAGVVLTGCRAESAGAALGGADAGRETDPPDATDSLATTDPSSTTAVTGASGTSAATSSSESAGFRFDLGVSETEATQEPCHRVDILYVIDNSGSMEDEQESLVANFPTFARDMQAALVGVDSYHIGVITPQDFGDSIFGPEHPIPYTVNRSVPECQALGALVVEGNAGLCTPFAAGNSFMTEADDIEEQFTCIARVGSDGPVDERTGDALVSLLQSQTMETEISECNAGFLRDDALLVIVVVTDEADSSETTAAQWYDAVLAAKGAPENVVVLSLLWHPAAPGCELGLTESHAREIVSFTEMFPVHAVGNLCADSYDGFFLESLPLVQSACDGFTPPS